jgi:hypothetical protein
VPKLANPQTQQALASAKPRSRPYKLADGRGLSLLVQPHGSKLWRFEYRRPDTHKRNALSLGIYPEVSLRDARTAREEMRAMLADGIDPAAQRIIEREEAHQRQAEAHARFLFSFAITDEGALHVSARGTTVRLSRSQTDVIRAALSADH